MFEVRTTSPFDEKWERRDEDIYRASGRVSDWSGAHGEAGRGSQRDHGWLVSSYEEAKRMWSNLTLVDGVEASWRETFSQCSEVV